MQSIEFLSAWRERARSWQERLPAPTPLPSGTVAEHALLAGEPLISLVDPLIEPAPFAQVLAELAGLYPQGSDLAAALAQASAEERIAVAQSLLAGEGPGDWAAQHEIKPDLLLTLAGLALQPFMARFGQAVADLAPLGIWRQNFCPVCGSAPDVCRIDPDNRRHLHCPQCDTQWEHHRLTCVTCDTDDVKQVKILSMDTMEPWRVEVCDLCGGYVKTLDQRHGGHLAMPRVDLYLEDARTLPLDLLAEEKGYRRGGRAQ